MIKSFSVENYKAFEKGTIELKPITILLGANSVGKSSLIQLLLLMQQTANANKGYKSALKLNGNIVSLGENANIFRNRNTQNPVVFSFEFEDESLYYKLKKTYIEDLVEEVIHTYVNYQMETFLNKKKKKIDFDPLNELIQREEIDKLKTEAINDESYFNTIVSKISRHKEASDIFFFTTNRLRISHSGIDADEYVNLYRFLKSCSELRIKRFSISFEIRCRNNSNNSSVLYLSKLTLSQKDNNGNDKIIASLLIQPDNDDFKSALFSLKSDFFQEREMLNKSIQKEVASRVNYHATIFSVFKSFERTYSEDNFFDWDASQKVRFIFVKRILDILSLSVNIIESSFLKEQINYVSPLRAYPKRYYFLDKANITTTLDTLDGDTITEVLRENEIVKRKVNKWFKNFSLEINVQALQDIIHKLTVKQHGIHLDITDVGFGISQVLPIVVQGFFAPNNTLTMIEQPEVHLHPKMQADLADLFIDMIKTRGKRQKVFFIETHSEYLLKRLRRRIAEGKNQNIQNEDVSIYLIYSEKEENCTTIKKLEVENKGNFEWPEDFYGGELFKDTMVFLKNQ